MNVDFDEIVEGKNKKNSPSGLECFFVPINENWALKCYSSSDLRDRCWSRQKTLAQHGIAPEVGETVDLKNGDCCFCYITEIVEVLADCELANKDENYFLETEDEILRIYSKEIEECEENVSAVTGYLIRDFHILNMGIKDNRIVPIDFGDFGFSGWCGDFYDA